MADNGGERLVEDKRCWPCTIINGLIALVLAAIPLYGALGTGDPVILGVTVVWAVGVIGYTLFRLLNRGYLPGAPRIAEATGLHDQIGPGRHDPDSEEPREDRIDSPGP
jgi:hypothetical protein